MKISRARDSFLNSTATASLETRLCCSLFSHGLHTKKSQRIRSDTLDNEQRAEEAAKAKRGGKERPRPAERKTKKLNPRENRIYNVENRKQDREICSEHENL